MGLFVHSALITDNIDIHIDLKLKLTPIILFKIYCEITRPSANINVYIFYVANN